VIFRPFWDFLPRLFCTGHQCAKLATCNISSNRLAVLAIRPSTSNTSALVCYGVFKCIVCLGGYYHGKLVFPREFPFKPPSIYMITPSGRFNVNTRCCFVCLNFLFVCSVEEWHITKITEYSYFLLVTFFNYLVKCLCSKYRHAQEVIEANCHIRLSYSKTVLSYSSGKINIIYKVWKRCR